MEFEKILRFQYSEIDSKYVLMYLSFDSVVLDFDFVHVCTLI